MKVHHKEQLPAANPHAEVTRAGLEAEIAAIRLRVARPTEGIFGADSITWRINRESALFLGAGRAALLQLAHPWVAAALDQHSSVLENPLARFHNTFRIVFTMIFGSTEQAFTASRFLYQRHTAIQGEMPAAVAKYAKGSRYEALQVHALLWVFATLVESAIIAYECVLPALSLEELATYYAEAKLLSSLFGLPPKALPDDWNAFRSYTAGMFDSQALGVNERSCYMAQKILTGAGSWIHVPRWYRALTAQWMPPRFRDEFKLEWGSVEQESARKATQTLPGVYRWIPATIRFVGPYHEARGRLVNHSPGLLAQQSNRFWIGEPLLPFGE